MRFYAIVETYKSGAFSATPVYSPTFDEFADAVKWSDAKIEEEKKNGTRPCFGGIRVALDASGRTVAESYTRTLAEEGK